MSSNIIPLTPQQSSALAPRSSSTTIQSWGPPPAPPARRTPQLQRVLSVFERFKWLILGLTVLGTVAGVIATRFVNPQYEVQGRVWISSEAPQTSSRNDPTRTPELVSAAAWVPLFTSGRIADDIARQLGLFVTPEEPADSAVFRDFAISDRFFPGDYELAVQGKQLVLTSATRQVVDRAPVGDSLGRTQGFLWRPDPTLLRDGRTIRFSVIQPREAGQRLSTSLVPTLEENFLTLTLTGQDPQLLQRTLQLWLERFVNVAGELKREKLAAAANVQQENLVRAEEELRRADMALQNFKVGTITLPTQGTAVAAGVQETQPTVMTNFFAQRMRLEDLRSVRAQLERIIRESRARGEISEADLFQLASLTRGEANTSITTAIAELNELQARRRALLRVYTDSAQNMVDMARQIARLQNTVILGQASSLLSQIRQEEADLNGRLRSAEAEIRDIPLRATEEQRLTRDRAVREDMYSRLKGSQQAAQLAAESVTADVSVLDWPVVPLHPSKNTVPQILAIGVVGGLLLGLLVAFLIDRVDHRFRYPEQAKDELGLDILGAVPRLRSIQKGTADAEESAQVLEAFRLMRMNVLHALDTPVPLAVTVSSAAAGDGKSLVASNLAVAFAEAGHRVLLVDGDIRRGSLHDAFGVAARPGLADVLAGTASRREALRSTTQRNLSLMPCGKRSRQAPELLESAAMVELLEQLKGSYDVIVVDSPPLSAGIDAQALGLATGAMIIVLRAGVTDMRLAHAKLAELDRKPIQMPGAVLNGITAKGIYQYYSYDYGYAAEDEDVGDEASPADRPALGMPAGDVTEPV